MNTLTLSYQAKDMIKNDILRGVYAPEEHLVVTRISKHYNIGATPVREALFFLTRDGYVKMEPKRGCYVTPINYDELDDLKHSLHTIGNCLIDVITFDRDEEWQMEQLKLNNRLRNFDMNGCFESKVEMLLDYFHVLLNTSQELSLNEYAAKLIEQIKRYIHFCLSSDALTTLLNTDQLKTDILNRINGEAESLKQAFHNQLVHLTTIIQLELSRKLVTA